jgi:hypothetical protein
MQARARRGIGSTKTEGTGVSGRKQARSEPALRKRFQAEEQQAIDAVARWVGHPAVRGVIERRRIGAETVVMPIERMLTDQVQVIWFCWHVFGLAGTEPGWELRNGEPVDAHHQRDEHNRPSGGRPSSRRADGRQGTRGRRGRSGPQLDRRPRRGRGAPAPGRYMGSARAGTSGGAAAAGDRRDPHRRLWHDPPARHRGAHQLAVVGQLSDADIAVAEGRGAVSPEAVTVLAARNDAAGG